MFVCLFVCSFTCQLVSLFVVVVVVVVVVVDRCLHIVITEAPSQLIAQSIGTRHMLLNWPIVPTTSCQSYPINYTLLYHSIYPDTSNTGELVIDSVTDNMLGSGDVFAVLSGLEEFYDYNVTVFASNRNGDGPAVSHSFKTLPTGLLLLIIYLLFAYQDR